ATQLVPKVISSSASAGPARQATAAPAARPSIVFFSMPILVLRLYPASLRGSLSGEIRSLSFGACGARPGAPCRISQEVCIARDMPAGRRAAYLRTALAGCFTYLRARRLHKKAAVVERGPCHPAGPVVAFAALSSPRLSHGPRHQPVHHPRSLRQVQPRDGGCARPAAGLLFRSARGRRQ